MGAGKFPQEYDLLVPELVLEFEPCAQEVPCEKIVIIAIAKTALFIIRFLFIPYSLR